MLLWDWRVLQVRLLVSMNYLSCVNKTDLLENCKYKVSKVWMYAKLSQPIGMQLCVGVYSIILKWMLLYWIDQLSYGFIYVCLQCMVSLSFVQHISRWVLAYLLTILMALCFLGLSSLIWQSIYSECIKIFIKRCVM